MSTITILPVSPLRYSGRARTGFTRTPPRDGLVQPIQQRRGPRSSPGSPSTHPPVHDPRASVPPSLPPIGVSIMPQRHTRPNRQRLRRVG